MNRAASTHGEKGVAIIAALWASAIVAVIVMSVLQLMKADAFLSHGRQEQARLQAAADGAINIAILAMLGPRETQPPTNGIPVSIQSVGHPARITVRDEAGKIDINHATVGTLRQLLVNAGLDTSQAIEVANRIIDWRDPQVENRTSASDDSAYRQAGRAYEPRSTAYQSVEELRLLLGMTDALYSTIAPSLTVYSQAQWVDPAYADASVLRVFAVGDATARTALQRLDEVKRGLAAPQPSPGVTLGHAYTITAEVGAPGGARAIRSTVIRLTDRQQSPVLIYRWD